MSAPKLRVRSSGFGGSGYSIPTRLDEKGKPIVVPGVTTITGVTAKPGIVQWAVDQTAAYAVANIDALLSRTDQQGWGMLRWYHKRTPDVEFGDLLDYHSGVLNDAAELGTGVHEWIEADLTDDFPPTIINEQMDEMIAHWQRFKSEHEIETLAVEATVFNPEHGYAGTLDGIWKIDGVTYLLDVKTSRNTWPEHYQQLAALDACTVMMVEGEDGEWSEQPIPAYEKYAILHLRPTDWDNNGNIMESFCTLKEVDNIPLHFEGFLGALALKKYERKLNTVTKEQIKEV